MGSFPFVGRILILQLFYPFKFIEYLLRQIDISNIKLFMGIHRKPGKKFIFTIFCHIIQSAAGNQWDILRRKETFRQDNPWTALNMMFLLSETKVISTFMSCQVIYLYERKKMIFNGQYVIFLMGISVSKRVIQLFRSKLAKVFIVFLISMQILIFNITVGPVCIIYCTKIVEDITYVIITRQLLPRCQSLNTWSSTLEISFWSTDEVSLPTCLWRKGWRKRINC